jgi:hypothetical protein
MRDPATPDEWARLDPVGLCARCRHARIVETPRGSTFYLCRRAEIDARFPKYPRLPVIRCAGFEAGPLPDR